MSTYYYLTCPEHAEYTCAASAAAGGPSLLCDSGLLLHPFVIAHSRCPVAIRNEHYHPEDDDTEWTEWSTDNVRHLYVLHSGCDWFDGESVSSRVTLPSGDHEVVTMPSTNGSIAAGTRTTIDGEQYRIEWAGGRLRAVPCALTDDGRAD